MVVICIYNTTPIYWVLLKLKLFFCRFDASFGDQTVTIAFKYLGLPDATPGQLKIVRKTNKMEIFV